MDTTSFSSLSKELKQNQSQYNPQTIGSNTQKDQVQLELSVLHKIDMASESFGLAQK